MGRRLVVGLGNPGPEYAYTWHNLGFQAVRSLAARLKTSLKAQRDTLVGRGRYAGHDIFLLLPQSYMNRSGEPVRRVAKEYGVDPEEILVVLDDHDLPRGKLRLRPSGGDGGHRGLRSVLREIGTNQVARLRIGFRDEASEPEVGGYEDLADRVTSPLTETERELFLQMSDGAAQVALDWIGVGAKAAMNRHNARLIVPPSKKGGMSE